MDELAYLDLDGEALEMVDLAARQAVSEVQENVEEHKGNHAPSDAEKNTIVGIKRNGTALTPDNNREVNITVPTKVSELENDEEFLKSSESLELGETSSTAYRGDRGKTAYNHSQVTSGNPHGVTKSDVGLGNVENKSSADIREEITSDNVTDALGYTPMNTALKGVADGVAELDSSGKVPSSQLPSYVDDVLEYSAKSSFPTTGETGKIYVDTSTNKTYRWSGSAYTEISASLALGTTSSTAYRGDRGKTAYDHSQITDGNPHNVTCSQIGAATSDELEELNASLTASDSLKFQFATDGEGNYGYLGADGSLIPFKGNAAAIVGSLGTSNIGVTTGITFTAPQKGKYTFITVGNNLDNSGDKNITVKKNDTVVKTITLPSTNPEFYIYKAENFDLDLEKDDVITVTKTTTNVGIVMDYVLT